MKANYVRFNGDRAAQIARLRSEGWTILNYKSAPVVLAYHELAGKIHAKAWRGRADKPAWYYTFRTMAAAEAHAQTFVADVAKSEAFRAARRTQSTKRIATSGRTWNAANPHPVYLKAARGEHVSYADLANLVRSALATEFQQCKFSVTSKGYSGGSSLSVHWTDGPTTKQVDAVVGCFETKNFDGSIDLAHGCSLWLYPDGSAHVAHDSGTQGSMGRAAEIIESPRNGTALLLSNVSHSYLHTSRSFSAAHLQRALDSVKAENWTELKTLDWSTIYVKPSDGSPYSSPTIKGATSIRLYNDWLDGFIYRRAGEIAA